MNSVPVKRPFVLSKIALRNFKIFRDFEMQFEPDLTLLVGDNGTGKSTLLDTLRIAIGSFFIKLGVGSGQSIYKSFATRETYRYGSEVRAESQFPVRVAAEGMIDGEFIEWARSLETQKGRTTRVDASAIMKISQHWQERVQEGDESLILPFLGYYGTSRLWGLNSFPSKRKIEKQGRLTGYENSLGASVDYEFMKNWFYRKAFMEFQNKTESHDYRTIRKMLASALEYLIECRDASIEYDAEYGDICISYADKERAYHFQELSSLSDGYRNVLILLSDIAFRMALLNPMLEEDILVRTPGVVLIDEVDLHLHPKWQSLILPLLMKSFPSVQFIATTHSPIVVSSIRSRCVRLLEAGESYGMRYETYGSNVETVLSDVMDTSNRIREVDELFSSLNEHLVERDVRGAKELIGQIREIVGDSDPDLVAQELSLDLIQIEGIDAVG